MQVFHESGATALTHDGVGYTADDAGRFDLPEPVALTLLARGGWHAYTGEQPEEDEAARLRREVDELKAALAKTAPKTARKPA